MEYVPYKNATTLDYVTWLSRHDGIGNMMSKGYKACRHLPQIPASIRSYRTGVYDLRNAVLQYFPVTPGDMDSYAYRQRALDLHVACWRQYQSYLRSRDDREAVARHYAERMARYECDPVAQDSKNA